ncbi:MAG: hypothetical protein LC713_03615, partial [Actinobacteria bacterium]|nr:hypothetical protein [Actinomycetota bacterium]
SGADGVVDFDQALRSNANVNELNPSFDSGDHVHPSYNGYSRMADTVDLNTLRGAAPCLPPPPPQATKLRVRAGGRPHHDLRVTGKLTTANKADCTGGQVTVRALRKGRSLLKRKLRLTSACTFAKTLALHASGRIEVRVSFAGRPSLRATRAASVFARVR